MPKITLNPFDPASVKKAVDDMRAFQKKVEKLGPELTTKLTETGVEAAKLNAMFMGAYDSGKLVDGIVGEERDGKGYVESTAAHSAFVEMGTGIRGKQDPNPNDYAAGWRYDVNEHGEKGWWYPGKDGRYHWTKGMPHRPFMYEAAQNIREAAPEAAREILEGKK